jgi:hypothetical protein
VPLGVLTAVGLGALGRVGLSRLEAALASARGRARRWGVALLLALPSAVLLGPGLAVLAAATGLGATRVRDRYVCVLAALAVLIPLLLRVGGALRLALLFPPLWVLAWLVAQRPPVWPTAASPGFAGGARWLLLTAVAGLGAVAVSVIVSRGIAMARAGIPALAAAYALVALARLAPAYVDPQYSIRDASRDLGRLLAQTAHPVRTLESEALLAENRLPYRTIVGRRFPATRAELLLLGAPIEDPLHLLEREYRLLRTWDIHTSPEYVRWRRERVTTPGPLPRTSIRLYQRIPTGG